MGGNPSTVALACWPVILLALVKRRVSPRDKRMKVVSLTETGRALLGRIDAGAARAHARTLAPLSPTARARFMRDLVHLVEFNNGVSRTPIGLR